MAVHKLILLENIRALGRPGLIGAALLLTGLAFSLAATLPASQELEQSRQRAARASALEARAASGEQLAPQTAEGQRTAFYRDFPQPTEVTHWIERIYAAAAAEQLSLAHGEYVMSTVNDTRLQRYQITLPVRADYGQLRRFISAAQAAVPKLHLDELSLQRQEIGEAQVDARIRLSLYLVNP
ncbi:MAG: pilus assembly protein PilO [Betaproteobacteria bacterium HGW-Betaproteobacteria-12]|nr:MAG: pilus assembly protein PilO [Betaproteobacteria bacterium HGW-Betaproteobacteria-12]